MKTGAWAFLAVIVILGAISCGGSEKPESGDPAVSAGRPIDELRGVHPRILLTGERLVKTKAGLNSTHNWLWQRYQQDLGPMVEMARSNGKPGDARQSGDMAIDLAFAWAMTGEDSLLEVARHHLLRLTDPQMWEASTSLMYLIGSHFLTGISLAYDWLYPALTPAERRQVAECLGRQAQAQYESIVTGRIWWRNQYYQNHSHSNYCGLAFAAAALWGEDERAEQWMEVCERFFDKLFEVLPADGSSVEGYAYAGYGAEYAIDYAAMAHDLLGKDYSSSPWLKNLSNYLLHGLLPNRTARTWAMTFGDGPQRGWTSTAQHLIYLAAAYRDGRAQWMARETTELRDSGLSGQGWMMLMYYDPSIPAAEPAEFPTSVYFPEVGQVMMRSSWTDTSGTLVGIKCGPFMGLTHSPNAVFDWGTGHAEPDAGSFQIFSHGKFMAIGALYTGYKLGGNHNTMLFKNKGQLGENLPAGFASVEALKFGHYPQIVHTDFSPAADYVVGDVAKAYHPALGLKKYLRRWVYLKPDILLVADEIELDEKGMVYDFPAPDLQLGHGMKHNQYGQITGNEGEAYTVFDGIEGQYQIYVSYLDNSPEIAEYAILADGAEIHRWKSHNQDIDDNLIEITPPVMLKKGSRISFHGSGMTDYWRLTKMAAFSGEVNTPRRVQWLMHFEPDNKIERQAGRVSAISGGVILDHYLLAPEDAEVKIENYATRDPGEEDFNYLTTKRLVVEPKLTGDKLSIITLLHIRPVGNQPLQQLAIDRKADALKVSWSKDGVPGSISLSMQTMSYQIK